MEVVLGVCLDAGEVEEALGGRHLDVVAEEQLDRLVQDLLLLNIEVLQAGKTNQVWNSVLKHKT